MLRTYLAPLALALAMAFTGPALACRDAPGDKPWRPPSAGSGPFVVTLDAKNVLKVFVVGRTAIGRMHLCVRVTPPDPMRPTSQIDLYFWAIENSDYYRIMLYRNKLSVIHLLNGKEYMLVPEMNLPAPQKDGDGMTEFDVKANDTGADVEIDGAPFVNIVARPTAASGGDGLMFGDDLDKSTTFRLGPVLAADPQTQ